MKTDKAVGFVCLGIVGTIYMYVAFKWVDDRLNRIERAARSFPTVEPPKSLDDMRRESAREFVALLREEGLTVTEAAT